VLQQHGNTARIGVTKHNPSEDMAAHPPYRCFSYGITNLQHPGHIDVTVAAGSPWSRVAKTGADAITASPSWYPILAWAFIIDITVYPRREESLKKKSSNQTSSFNMYNGRKFTRTCSSRSPILLIEGVIKQTHRSFSAWIRALWCLTSFSIPFTFKLSWL